MTLQTWFLLIVALNQPACATVANQVLAIHREEDQFLEAHPERM